jgi:hypothetical protein
MNVYAELYSAVESRPNFPVNIWAGLEILKGMFDYTDEECQSGRNY